MHSWWRGLVIAAGLGVVIPVCSGSCGNRTRTVGGTGPTRGAEEFDGGVGRAEDGAPAAAIRRALHLATEFQIIDPDAVPPQTAVDLVMTDETGASDRVTVGEFTGTCTDVSAKHKQGPMKPVLSVDCAHNNDGTLLRFVPRLGHLIILRSRVELDSGEEPAFDEHKRVPMPAGVPLMTD